MKKQIKYPAASSEPLLAKDMMAPVSFQHLSKRDAAMTRTQIYLNRAEYDFLQTESLRRGEPMAAVIRSLIDEKMRIPEDVWTNNPMLRPTPAEPDAQDHEDSGLNHDHYIYGSPKKWIKVNGQWVEAPPPPDDYYENRTAAETYDKEILRLDESR